METTSSVAVLECVEFAQPNDTVETTRSSPRESASASAVATWPVDFAPPNDTIETTRSTLRDSASPWLVNQLKVIARLATLGPGWEVSGAAPPNETALGLAREVLQTLARIDLQPNRIGPSTDEGVCISFERNGRYADIECFNTGDMLAVTHTSKAQPRIWSLSVRGIESAVATISSYIYG